MVSYDLKPSKSPQNAITELRSDTFTSPDAPMLEAMRTARIGDDVYGEDPSVNELQDRFAAMTGKPSALFLSSGTQSNLAALLAHCGRGEEVISGDKYHVVIDEAMGASVLGGLAMQSVATDASGVLSVESVRQAIKPQDVHCPVSRLISLENTVWGRVQPYDNFVEMRALADSHGLLLHLDGARLFHAVVASELSLDEICRPFDSVSLCLSKGLGAPIGTVLCGNNDFILRALRIRKMLGGGMRQAGFAAAAGLYALENNIARLAEDHTHARHLCDSLQKYTAQMQAPPQCHTNMVFVYPKQTDHPTLSQFMQKNGVMLPETHPSMRLVLHKGVSCEAVDYALEKFAEYYNR